MAPIEHIIDPDPDTIITLRNPCSVFAPWGPAQEDDESSILSDTTEDLTDPIEPTLEAPDASVDYSEELATIVESSASQDGIVLGESAPLPDEPEEPIELVEPERMSVRYHVSSRHLMLASPVFKRLLTKNGFAESIRCEVDGLYHVTAHDLDAEAFLIVLQIVHGRNKQIPREVTLEMLTKIAVVADYYRFGEALDIFTEVWIRELIRESTPSTYDRDLVMWICVAWVFNIEDRFLEATFTAIKESNGSFWTLDLPIPLIVSVKIDSKRNLAIEAVMEALTQRLENYRSPDYVCRYSDAQSFMCGSFLLGSMTKELSRLNLVYPRPEIPFPGLSFSQICKLLRDIKSPIWYYDPGRFGSSHGCTLRAEIKTMIEGVSTAVGGLNLGDVKKRRDR